MGERCQETAKEHARVRVIRREFVLRKHRWLFRRRLRTKIGLIRARIMRVFHPFAAHARAAAASDGVQLAHRAGLPAPQRSRRCGGQEKIFKINARKSSAGRSLFFTRYTSSSLDRAWANNGCSYFERMRVLQDETDFALWAVSHTVVITQSGRESMRNKEISAFKRVLLWISCLQPQRRGRLTSLPLSNRHGYSGPSFWSAIHKWCRLPPATPVLLPTVLNLCGLPTFPSNFHVFSFPFPDQKTSFHNRPLNKYYIWGCSR